MDNDIMNEIMNDKQRRRKKKVIKNNLFMWLNWPKDLIMHIN